MAALHEHLYKNCDFTSVAKHARSFVDLMFNFNFRGLYVFDMRTINNKRMGMLYDCLMELPNYFKVWMREELNRLEPYFRKSIPGRPKQPDVEFVPAAWWNKFRALFNEAGRQAFNKTKKVIKYNGY